jgi:hypothetical protein
MEERGDMDVRDLHHPGELRVAAVTGELFEECGDALTCMADIGATAVFVRNGRPLTRVEIARLAAPLLPGAGEAQRSGNAGRPA